MFRFAHMGRFGHMGVDNFWGGGSMMIFWAILLAAVIYFIVQKSNENKNFSSQGSYSPQYNNHNFDREYNESAEETARQRYASGEISKDEFEKIIKNLRR